MERGELWVAILPAAWRKQQGVGERRLAHRLRDRELTVESEGTWTRPLGPESSCFSN